MELLRLLSMFLVLVIHANTVYDPWPINQQAVLAKPGICTFRFLVESLSAVCVNAFILLSGWFGIRFSFKRLFSFIFQVLFFSLILTLLPSAREFKGQLFFDIFTLKQYWFVRAYIILFILSPALNLFAEQAPKSVFRNVLIAYFTMQTVFSYITNSSWFDDGFSPIPFIGLYLLARYVRIHKPAFSSFKKEMDLSIYFGMALLMTTLSIFLFRCFGTGGRMFNYTNPLVIASSLYFVLFFSKIRMKNSRIINWVAISSVGAYLLHMNPLFFQPHFIGTLKSIPGEFSYLTTCLITIAFIFAVFITGVLLDKIRELIWNNALRILKMN